MAIHDDSAVAHLPAAPASTIKKQGWKGVMRSLSETGRLVVTNHSEPEAVILSTAEYAKLVNSAKSATADPLKVLRERFDERLARLNSPDAGDKLRKLIRKPGVLGGEVKAGDSF